MHGNRLLGQASLPLGFGRAEYFAALPGPRSAVAAITRVKPSLQPSGVDSMAGGPPAPSGSPGRSTMRS